MKLIYGFSIILISFLLRAEDRVYPIHELDSDVHLEIKGPKSFVPEGPQEQMVLKTDGHIKMRFDLNTIDANLKNYHQLRFDAKVAAHALIVVSLENYPEPGVLSNWYPLDIARGASDWKSYHLDLSRPEEMRKSGKAGGMSKLDPSKVGIRIRAKVHDTKRKQQSKDRTILMKDLRFVRNAIHIDWDQRKAPYTWGKGKDLVYSYPIEITNLLDESCKAKVKLTPFQQKHALAKVSDETLILKPHEKRVVIAEIRLPADQVAKQKPLYCERFSISVRAIGYEDSEVTLLRSSDPLHLSVTIPLAEEDLQFPFFPKRKDLPEEVTSLGERKLKRAREYAKEVKASDLNIVLSKPLEIFMPGNGINPLGQSKVTPHVREASERLEKGLSSCAMLYDKNRDTKLLAKGTDILKKFAEVFPRRLDEYERLPVNLISHGILTQYTLSLGWKLGGDWPVYMFSPRLNQGIFNDFDILAKDMNPADRQEIIDDFIVPAAIQMRNHLIGLNNMQDVVNYAIMYAGMVSRNWPLVSFALSSEHGLLNQVKLGFDDDGLCNEGHYQVARLNPILWTTELLFHRGIDIYDQRLYNILFSRSAKAIGKTYDMPIRDFLVSNRFSMRNITPLAKTDGGYHQPSGTTMLHWKGLYVNMNWNTHIYRNAFDRCSLIIKTDKEHKLRSLHGAGDGSYSHSSFGQSIIIVDNQVQNSVSADILSHDVEGPVQHVQSFSDRHYPGSKITRTFILLEDQILTVDRIANEKPATVDWCLKQTGNKLSVPMTFKKGSFITKPDEPHKGITYGASIRHHNHGKTDDAWTEGNGRINFAAQKGTEIYTVPAWYRKTMTIVRRKKVKATDYIASFSLDTQRIEKLPVTLKSGKIAKATGVLITTKSGRQITTIVSYEPEGTLLQCGKFKSTERVSSDYPGKRINNAKNI